MPRSTQSDFGQQSPSGGPAWPDETSTVIGIDYSGAAQSGKTAWLAHCEVMADKTLRLVALDPLERLAESPFRDDVNAYLVARMLAADKTLVGADFPFSLPLALDLGDWKSQLDHVADFQGDAKQYGRMLVKRTENITGGQKHIRRQTDRDSATPFDCYHYRIIYQTFHGMRDVLRPLSIANAIRVIPFQDVLPGTDVVVAEACPSSTLKRLGLPHQNYKQSGNRAPEEKHLVNRRRILSGIRGKIMVSQHRRGVILKNPGGDALDSVLAAVGVWDAVRCGSPAANQRRGSRDCVEGRVYF